MKTLGNRPILALTLCGLVAGLASPSLAAGKLAKAVPLTVMDAKGDANGINGQFRGLPVPEQSNESINQKSADIVSFTLGRKDDGNKVKSFTGSLTLAAPPAENTDYRIRMKTADCATYFLEYEFAATGSTGYVRENCGGAPTTAFDPVGAQVAGNTITWIIPVKRMPGTVKLGTDVTVLGAQTSLDTVAIVPGLDQVVTDKAFVIGQ